MFLTNKKAALEAAKMAAIALLIIGLAAALLPNQADAGVLKVYSPIVEKGELEIENTGVFEDDNELETKFEVGYGGLDFDHAWFKPSRRIPVPELLQLESQAERFQEGNGSGPAEGVA